MSISVCWFRKDLRLNDNPAWNSACSDGDVIPVFVLEPSMLESASQRKKDVMFSNLMALKAELESLGGYLQVIEGPQHKHSRPSDEMGLHKPSFQQRPFTHREKP